MYQTNVCHFNYSIGFCANLNLDGGTIEYTGHQVGDIAYYKCQPGSVIVGNVERQCQSNGEWDGKQPICISMILCM